jgi:hypothetical protein
LFILRNNRITHHLPFVVFFQELFCFDVADIDDLNFVFGVSYFEHHDGGASATQEVSEGRVPNVRVVCSISLPIPLPSPFPFILCCFG